MNYHEDCRKAALALTQPKRDEILRDIKKGKTLGSVADEHSVSMDAVCGVLTMNIQSFHVLSDTSR